MYHLLSWLRISIRLSAVASTMARLACLAGLEVIRTLNDAGITTEKPIALVNWTNEEGVRFEPAMQGSGAAIGKFRRKPTFMPGLIGTASGSVRNSIGSVIAVIRSTARCRPVLISNFISSRDRSSRMPAKRLGGGWDRRDYLDRSDDHRAVRPCWTVTDAITA